MTDYEKQKHENPTDEKSIEEIDPDYIVGGAKIVPTEETEGLHPTNSTQICDCGEFSPNDSGICGTNICANCKYSMTPEDNPKATFCSIQPRIIDIS